MNAIVLVLAIELHLGLLSFGVRLLLSFVKNENRRKEGTKFKD